MKTAISRYKKDRKLYKNIGDIQLLIKNPTYRVYSNNIGYCTISDSQ